MNTLNEIKCNDAVLIKDAARIAKHSLNWIRRRRTFGPLVAVEVNGFHAVTYKSLMALLDSIRVKEVVPTPSRPALFLIVDNTK